MTPETTSVPPSPLERLVDDTIQHLQGLGYSLGYLRLCRGVWRHFISFSLHSSDPQREFSEELATQFLASCGIASVVTTPSSLSGRQRMIRAVMRILGEFHLHGCYQRRRRTQQKVQLPTSLQTVLRTYLEFCKDHLRCKAGTIRCRTRHLTRFLHFVDSHHGDDPATIQAKHLSDFLRSQIHLKPKTLAVIVSDLRSFLRFLCMQRIAPEDLSPQVPKIRIPRDARIPSVWNDEDVDALLAAVDRSSPKGKRDYAILMLAGRLGMRVSDIRGLCLENIRWDKNRIEIAQSKTGGALVLPLSEEVGEALIDHLKHGRPITKYREVFLRINAPIEPFSSNDNLHHIITFYRQRAGIALPPQTRQGLHSLRHTVATRLLEAGTPLETIASILGHVSLESTQIYTKVDIEALRSAALELEATDE